MKFDIVLTLTLVVEARYYSRAVEEAKNEVLATLTKAWENEKDFTLLKIEEAE